MTQMRDLGPSYAHAARLWEARARAAEAERDELLAALTGLVALIENKRRELV